MTMKRVTALTWTTLILATDLVWLLGLVVCALAGLPIARHHLEAASIALAVGFCLHVVSVSRESGRPRLPSWTTPPRTVLVVPAAVAVIAFAWSVRLGPLSDDFVLRQWAASGDWATAGWDFFRPLPLALWSLLIPIGDWPALHVANIAIHAINSGLVAALVHGWYGRRAAVAAGVTFALLPTNIEAVA